MCALTKKYEAKLKAFENKVLRRICGPVVQLKNGVNGKTKSRVCTGDLTTLKWLTKRNVHVEMEEMVL